jgi:hypothetical protein
VVAIPNFFELMRLSIDREFEETLDIIYEELESILACPFTAFAKQ